jgi:hypothetical protein
MLTLVSPKMKRRVALGMALVYVRATFARSRDPDAALKHLQTEIFAKASWAFDVL